MYASSSGSLHRCLLTNISSAVRVSFITNGSVCVRDKKEAFSVKPRFPDRFQYLVLDVQDHEEQNLIRLFPPYVSKSSHQGFHIQSEILRDCFFLSAEQISSSLVLYLAVGVCWYIAMVNALSSSSFGSDVCLYSGGISLSPAFVIMFVMQHYQLSWEDALHLVQNRRYCISPNGGFLTQIKVGYSSGHPLNDRDDIPRLLSPRWLSEGS